MDQTHLQRIDPRRGLLPGLLLGGPLKRLPSNSSDSVTQRYSIRAILLIGSQKTVIESQNPISSTINGGLASVLVTPVPTRGFIVAFRACNG